MTHAGDDSVLAGLVAEALARIDRGEATDVATICADHPELAGPLAEILAIAQSPELGREPRRDPRLDSVLADRYRLLERIGAGALGAVYRARDEVLRREVAVKILHAGASASATEQERFVREARALAALRHPHIVQVHDHGRAAGVLFLVTDLLAGASLREVLERSSRAMPDGPTAEAFADGGFVRELLGDAAELDPSYLRQIVRWCADLAAALATAHAHGILHRDVKPSNAFVTCEGQIVLLDFGLAVHGDDPSVTATGSLVGTPVYMAPEQAAGRDPDPRADVYSLAATLYHLLALRPAHDGDLVQIVHELQTVDPTPVQRIHRGLPTDLAAIVDKGMEKYPQRRYGSAAEFEADLRAFLDHRPVAARPLRAFGRLWRRARRRPARTLAIAATTTAILLALVTVPLWQHVAETRTRARYDELLPTVPALIALEGNAEQRMMRELSADRAAGVALLDQLLGLRPDDLATRVLRSALLLDHGDHERAARDVVFLSARAATPYLRAIAERFAAAAADRSSTNEIDLTGLPEPTTPVDCFVAGFHALRDRDVQRSLALLDRAIDYEPARDFRLLALVACGRYDDALAEASFLEGRHGETARTQHARAAALLGLKRYEDAIAPARRSIELCPDRHGPWNNLGLAYLRAGRLDEARLALERALEIAPWLDNTKSHLAQLWRDSGDHARSEAYALTIDSPWLRDYELGMTTYAASLAALARGETELARDRARRGIDTLRESLDHDGHRKRHSTEISLAILESVVSGDQHAIVLGVLSMLRDDALNHVQIMNLADLLTRQSLDNAEVTALRAYLYELAKALAPGDLRPAKYLAELDSAPVPLVERPDARDRR